MDAQPSDSDVIALERAAPGTSFEGGRLHTPFLKRMQRHGYLDAEFCRTSALGRLQEIYRTEGLALFLGAGVARGSDIPDWRGLLDHLLGSMRQAMPGTGKQPTDKTPSETLEQDARLPLTSQFDLVAHDCAGPDRTREFTERLRTGLYGGEKMQELRRLANAIPESNKDKKNHDWAPLLKELRRNTTLASVGDLLVKQQRSESMLNPNIHGVLTTNVDNLVQLYVMSLSGGTRLVDTVNYPGAYETRGRLPVFHLHGWLDMRDSRSAAVPSPPLVFRESEYFDAIANPNGFANHTAQFFCQRRNIAFVGTSLEDLNVRRWLYNAFKERRESLQKFLADRFPGYAGAGAEAYAASIRHFWFKWETELPQPSGAFKTFLEDAMRHLGVQIIWYAEHAQVGTWLRGLAADEPLNGKDLPPLTHDRNPG
jgi:hypothetical protein